VASWLLRSGGGTGRAPRHQRQAGGRQQVHRAARGMAVEEQRQPGREAGGGGEQARSRVTGRSLTHRARAVGPRYPRACAPGGDGRARLSSSTALRRASARAPRQRDERQREALVLEAPRWSMSCRCCRTARRAGAAVALRHRRAHTRAAGRHGRAGRVAALAAARELVEETGYRRAPSSCWAEVEPNPAFLSKPLRDLSRHRAGARRRSGGRRRGGDRGSSSRRAGAAGAGGHRRDPARPGGGRSLSLEVAAARHDRGGHPDANRTLFEALRPGRRVRARVRRDTGWSCAAALGAGDRRRLLEVSCAADPKRDRFAAHPGARAASGAASSSAFLRARRGAPPVAVRRGRALRALRRAEPYRFYPTSSRRSTSSRARWACARGGLGTGTSACRRRALPPRLVSRFEAILTAARSGREAAIPSIFTAPVERLGLSPGRVLHVRRTALGRTSSERAGHRPECAAPRARRRRRTSRLEEVASVSPPSRRLRSRCVWSPPW